VTLRLVPDLVLTGEGWRSGHAVTLAEGRIASIEPAARPAAGDVPLAGKALLPGTVNAHCHTFQSLLRGLGDDLDFAGWRDRVLYPYSERLDRRGIALGAAFAFAEMLRHGATTCVDFFYLQDQGNENAEAVIEAARMVGIRLVLARTMYDWDGAPRRYRESPADAARRTRELIAAHRRDDTTVVQPAPHSPHGASPAMIRAGFEVAESEATRFHIHVAEGRYEGERTVREHGATPIRYLDRLGVLGARMIGVHCVWLDDEEVALMGARRAALAYCPSSNMFLGDGVTRLPELRRAGVRVGLGTDGGCTNNRLSVFGEMRMAALLQRVRLLDGGALDAATAFDLGTRSGADILGLEAGTIAPGRLADLVAVDLGDASMHPPVDILKSVVFAMSDRAVTDVWVHGRRVVDQGRLATLDEGELLGRVRELTRDWRAPEPAAGAGLGRSAVS
jgi:5-methylthioadenosine/S-adenosylhomocysteine deaminase